MKGCGSASSSRRLSAGIIRGGGGHWAVWIGGDGWKNIPSGVSRWCLEDGLCSSPTRAAGRSSVASQGLLGGSKSLKVDVSSLPQPVSIHCRGRFLAPRAPAEFGSETPCFRASWGLTGGSSEAQGLDRQKEGGQARSPPWSGVGGLGNGQTETLGPVALHCRIWLELQFVALPRGLLL